MAVVLTRRNRIVVAGQAFADHLRVIDTVCRRPDGGVMAVFANVAGPDVVEGLAGCVCAVVTAEAVAGNVCMIEGRRQPRYRCMAVVTIITAGNVRLTLAQRDRIVVTGHAGADDLRVIHPIRR